MNWKDFWNFLWNERIGYRRPSPLTEEDRRLRRVMQDRIEKAGLDVELDLLGLGVKRTPEPRKFR